MSRPVRLVRCTFEQRKTKSENLKEIMKRLTTICAMILVAGSVLLQAGDAPKPVAKQPSPEFERLKVLVGTWEGKADFGQGEVDMTVQYRLLAGGTVIEERS